MPFIKKNHAQDTQTSSIFIGRTSELLFFVHNILQPEVPTHNILSISGQGGIGKSTLLNHFSTEAHKASFQDYCLTALVDERQATPIDMMEQIAQQLHLTGAFVKMLNRYKETLRRQHIEQETFSHRLFESTPDIVGALVEGIPIAGPLLREGAKIATKHLVREDQISQFTQRATFLEHSLDDLTKRFVAELNRLADANVILGSTRKKRGRRIVLFFDTFEQLAPEATPWLLDHFLATQISSNVVLVVAGRDPIERTAPDSPKRWLPYCDNGTIYWISLSSFTEDETRLYLIKKRITEEDQIATIWHMSQGLPLYLGLLTTSSQRDLDPTKDVIANFLCWIPEKEQIYHQLALDAALFSKPFNQDDLKIFSYVTESERGSLYQWLTEQPFVRGQSHDGQYVYHDVTRELFSRHLYYSSQEHYYEIRRALATYYQELLEKIEAEQGEEVYHSEEWLELTIALAHQLFLLPDKGSHTQALEQILRTYARRSKTGEAVRLLRNLVQGDAGGQVSVRTQQSAKHVLRYMELQHIKDVGDPQGFLEAVEYLLEQVVNEQTWLVQAFYYQRGNAYLYLGHYEQAIADYNQAIAIYPENSSAYYQLGDTYQYLKQYEQAIVAYNQAIVACNQAIILNHPKQAGLYCRRGNIYRSLHYDYEEVVAGREPPSSINADLYYRRGSVYQRLVEDYKQAIADFSQAIKLKSCANYSRDRGIAHVICANYYHNRGIAHVILEQYEQAITDYNQAEALNPNKAPLYHNRGNAYYYIGHYEQAIADYDQAITLRPTARRYHNRGKAYRRLKKYEQALADHNRALELAPKEDWYYTGRGLTYLWLKDVNRARTDYIRSWELCPTDAYNGWMVEWLRMSQEGIDLETAERLESVAAADPLHDRACACRGVALWIRGNTKEALAELESTLSSLAREKWAIYFWKGMILASIGEEDEAITTLKKALSMYLPPVLLSSLRCLEQRNFDFYKNYALPLLAKHGV